MDFNWPEIIWSNILIAVRTRVVIHQEISERRKSLQIPENLYAKNLIRFRKGRKKRQVGTKSFSESIGAFPHRLRCLFNHHLSALVYRPYE